MAMLPVAFALAWLLARARFPGKLILDTLVHLPLVVPPVVTGWLLLLLFGPQGPIGRWLLDWFGITLLFRWTGAALAAAIMALPLMVRAMRLSIAAIDHRLEQAAQTLGASAVRIFCTISLPLALPGIFAGAMLGFARSIGEFGATITFVSDIPGETRTLPIAIYSALQLPDSDHVVLRLALLSRDDPMIFDIDIHLRRGDRDIACRIRSDSGIIALFGPSGVGKTSTLNMIAGLLRPDHGHIAIGGQRLFDSHAGIDIAAARRRCGYVFQEPRLFPHMRVRANLRYGRPRGQADGGVHGLSQEALIELLGIGSLLDRWPASLSGGEAQRAAIGRALLSTPRLLLLDEPISSLDLARRTEILALIARLHALTGIAVVYVSHDRAELDYLAGDVIALS
ncbi:hypothetical protein LTR94_003048 [Friedmanniomyces endolithicus]|nr:hypothetical protein LTR94_003048 [Friedmanniomyces endolithicus]